MSSELQKEFARIMSDVFHELNEIIGYEYFQPSQIKKIAKNYLKFLPLVEEILMKSRGVTLRDIEKEERNYEKGKQAAMIGILDGLILKDYKGNTFKEKFKNYIHDPGIEPKWLQTTDYDRYLQILLDFVSKISSNTVLQFAFNYKSKKLVPISQGIVRVLNKEMFFRDVLTLDEKTIDETLEIFRELGAIAEHHLKLLYAMR
jgi:hypothetical protein